MFRFQNRGAATLISPDILNPGHLHFISPTDSNVIGAFKLELQTVIGNGKLTRTGMANTSKIKDSLNIAMNYFKANSQRVSSGIIPTNWDFLLQIIDLQGNGIPKKLD